MFSTIGLTEEEARGKFGYLMDAFELGAPPHGGERPGRAQRAPPLPSCCIARGVVLLAA